jgi:ArsR family transcriptional regulator
MIEEKTKLFKTLSDPNRLRILKMLQIKPLCVCEITDVLQLATSTVSKHLSILKETGFIIEEKDGKWVNYMINPRPDDPRISSIISTLDFWIADQKIINEDKLKVIKVDRYTVCSR